MPDLSRQAVNLFWCEYDRRVLYRIVTSMERVENWTKDEFPNINDALMLLGQLMDENTEQEVEELDALVNLLANSRSARTLRIMQYLDSVKPGTASKILMHAEKLRDEQDDPEAKLFLNRNMVFERLQLIARVFAPERVNLVIRALEKEDV